MTEYKLVPVEIDWDMWQAAMPYLEKMVAQGGANANEFSDAFKAACAAAPAKPSEHKIVPVEPTTSIREMLRGLLYPDCQGCSDHHIDGVYRELIEYAEGLG